MSPLNARDSRLHSRSSYYISLNPPGSLLSWFWTCISIPPSSFLLPVLTRTQPSIQSLALNKAVGHICNFQIGSKFKASLGCMRLFFFFFKQQQHIKAGLFSFLWPETTTHKCLCEQAPLAKYTQTLASLSNLQQCVTSSVEISLCLQWEVQRDIIDAY